MDDQDARILEALAQQRDVLLIAPPGCGKTERLARTALNLVQSRHVALPRQLLALTFSHKAKANLRDRIQKQLGPNCDKYVTVQTLHGFGFRLIRHHAPIVGRNSELTPPASAASLAGLRREVCESFGTSDLELQGVLHEVKRSELSDDEVLERLEDLHPAAFAYELALRRNLRMDFDDAIRLGTRILRNDCVRSLYCERYPYLLIDELQDLTMGQYEFASILRGNTTIFAGDRAQGIYRFAGAAPDEVLEAVLKRSPLSLNLDRSYRSTPNILLVVSELGEALGGTSVAPAEGLDWSTQGEVSIRKFVNPSHEAEYVLKRVRDWVTLDPQATIGVMVRAGHRRKTVDEFVFASEIKAEVWDLPSHRPGVVRLLEAHVLDAVLTAGEGAGGVAELRKLCFAALSEGDVEIFDELVEAFIVLSREVAATSLAQLVGNLRATIDPSASVRPGLHLLNGHLGKGQQFDHVVVLGLEEGHIPYYLAKTTEDDIDELAILHVMASRARLSLVFTFCSDVPTERGQWLRKESRWLPTLRKFET